MDKILIIFPVCRSGLILIWFWKKFRIWLSELKWRQLTRFWPEMWTHNFNAQSKRNNQVRFAHFESLIKKQMQLTQFLIFQSVKKMQCEKNHRKKPVNANDFITLHKLVCMVILTFSWKITFGNCVDLPLKMEHIVWKYSKCRIWIFQFWTFSTNFCRIKTDLSGKHCLKITQNESCSFGIFHQFLSYF